MMRTLVQLIDLVTSDTLTLTVSGILVLAVLALLVLLAWPTRSTAASRASRAGRRAPSATPARTHATTPASTRSAEARALFASGAPAVDVARQTGLSRDALALLAGIAAASARQKAPASARVSVWRRLVRWAGGAPARQQATV